MPRILLKRKTTTHNLRRKVRLLVLTDRVIYRRAMEVVRQLDAKRGARSQAVLVTKQKETTSVPLIVKGEAQREGVHDMTRGGVCHRPDLWYEGGKACDLCALYPWCLRDAKKLKRSSSQRADQNAKYFRDLAKQESYQSIRTGPRVRIKKKPKIRIK